ncbi:MAG: PIN domain-containing protein [Candidatus Eremiobacteraeota bacterium]|nr:PIN domain-containing protein [Candidatus Eremiobacteraeota bacterium]
MILADTSVWIDHLRFGSAKLRSLLSEGQVCVHPFVIGEIACGALQNRVSVLVDLAALPRVDCASDEEVLSFIEERKLCGKGIGWIDAHLLAAAVLSKCSLWTLDRALNRAALTVRAAV